MADRNELLKQIQEISFTLNDLTLYLDTHPMDTDALDAFSQAQAQRKELMSNYARDFGPLTIDCISQKHFSWSDGLLTDIGTEELAHLEIICAIIYQLTKNMKIEDAKAAGFDAYYIDHTAALWPTAAAGVPFNACEFQSKGDAITDLHENLAAEQKARTTYDNLIRLIPYPEVRDPLKFLRAREVVHFQRFGEALEKIKSDLDAKNYYYFNPEFDKALMK